MCLLIARSHTPCVNLPLSLIDRVILDWIRSRKRGVRCEYDFRVFEDEVNHCEGDYQLQRAKAKYQILKEKYCKWGVGSAQTCNNISIQRLYLRSLPRKSLVLTDTIRFHSLDTVWYGTSCPGPNKMCFIWQNAQALPGVGHDAAGDSQMSSGLDCFYAVFCISIFCRAFLQIWIR